MDKRHCFVLLALVYKNKVMFIGVTWSAFLFWLSISTVVYLLVIGWMYYRNNILTFFKRGTDEPGTIVPVGTKPGNPLPIVHELVNELGVLIRAAAEGHTIHAELFFSLQNITKNYLILAGTEFPPKINQYIREELLRLGIPDLSAEEYEALWREGMPTASR